MKITSAEFIRGIRGTDDIVYQPHQIAFVGRSNVGKSSLLNSITFRRGLARTSADPGKTREINFYRINKKWYFVDLPGYGYAKTSHENQETIRKHILWYLFDSEAVIEKVVIVIDSKVGVTAFDKELIEALEEFGHPFLVVANKIDNLNTTERGAQLEKIKRALPEKTLVVPHSALTKEGREMVLRAILR